MRVCNCGETLSASVQRKTAEIDAATRARPQLCERAKLFIATPCCDISGRCASKFPDSCYRSPVLPRVTLVCKATCLLDPRDFDAACARTRAAHFVFSKYRSSSERTKFQRRCPK